MKANLIIPSWSYWREPLRSQPLTQLYLATILEEKKINVEFTDYRDISQVIPYIPNESDMYLYTVASPDYKETRRIAEWIKFLYPKSKHIAGGPHPSVLPHETEGFDSIVVGRGEEALEKIIGDFPNLYSLYKENSKKDYPFPKRHFLPREKIVMDNLFKTDNIKSTTVQFSFGCPFDCSFCANYNCGPIRRNSLEKISNEIDYLKSEYGIEGLSLQDEVALPFIRKDAEKLLDLFKSKDIYWRGQIRVLKDTSILKQAKESGLIELSFGLESVNKDVLDLINKKIKVEDVEKMLKSCKEYGIKTRLYLINGLPKEPEDIVPQTIDFIEKNSPDIILLSSLQPYPGSPIYNNPQKYGIKWISKDYEKFSHLRDADRDIDELVPFEYKNGFSRERIVDNLKALESYLKERRILNK